MTAVALTAALFYVLWSRPPASTPDRSGSLRARRRPFRSKFELANDSFQAKNYRAALAYSGEVLAIARSLARRRFATKRAMVACRHGDCGCAATQTRDVRRTAQALESARAIDPTHPASARSRRDWRTR
jgi:hypothetical protein